jgi:adenylate cyclase, class 2
MQIDAKQVRECNQLRTIMVTGGTETEVKIRLPGASDIGERLRVVGFAISAPRVFESNTLYDTEQGELASKGMLLRLRHAGEHAVITWKGRGAAGPYKSRPELETAIGSTEVLHQILTQLGYRRSFRYEKYRTEFTRGAEAAGVVTLDETPIGDFLELEGPGEWIDETAAKLGFSRDDYILDSYGRLYVADCERRGVEPGHMVFASHG